MGARAAAGDRAAGIKRRTSAWSSRQLGAGYAVAATPARRQARARSACVRHESACTAIRPIPVSLMSRTSSDVLLVSVPESPRARRLHVARRVLWGDGAEARCFRRANGRAEYIGMARLEPGRARKVVVPRYGFFRRTARPCRIRGQAHGDSLKRLRQHTLAAAQAILHRASGELRMLETVCKLCGIAPDVTSATWRSTATPPPRGRRRCSRCAGMLDAGDEIASWVSVRV